MKQRFAAVVVEVSRMELQPGEVLVWRYPDEMPVPARAELAQALRVAFPNTRSIGLPRSVEMARVKAAAQSEASRILVPG